MCVKRFWQEILKFSEKDGVKKMVGRGGLIVERFYWRKKMKVKKSLRAVWRHRGTMTRGVREKANCCRRIYPQLRRASSIDTRVPFFFLLVVLSIVSLIKININIF